MMTDLVVDDFLKETILVPSYAEQQKIGAYFRNLDQQISLQTQRLEKLKQIKKPPQAIADSKIMSTFATAKRKRVSPIRPAPFESSRA